LHRKLVLRLAIQLALSSRILLVLSDSSSITAPSLFTSTPEVSPFLRRHYPASSVLWPSPTPRLAAALSGDVRGRDPQPIPSLLTDPDTFPACRAQYPGGPAQVLIGWRVARSRAGFFPVVLPSPLSGRSASTSLLSRPAQASHAYGLQSCSPTIPGFIARLRPGRVPVGRSQATKFNQQPPWWVLPHW